MKSTFAMTIVAFATMASAREHKRDECATACNNAYNSCTAKPDASQAFCAEEYERCLGFNPFLGANSIPAPTACSKGAAGVTTSAAGNVATTIRNTLPIVGDQTQSAADETSASAGAESTGEAETSDQSGTTDAAETKDAAETMDGDQATDVTNTSLAAANTATNIPDTYNCPSDCGDDYNTCRTTAGANMATCAAQYAQCLGYNPFDGDGSLVTPTACSVPVSQTTQPSQQVTTAEQSAMNSQSATMEQETTLQQVTTAQQPVVSEPTACDDSACMDGGMTGGEAPPMATETPVIVAAAGVVRPFVILAVIVALVIV
ncbi:hypothetical protein NW762_011535 [Fusarium torreyae]|uniref:Uncharacterized protein n=1 Tax=Fusarium torreyae TaxID=1237075 RepID=A0A9W8RTS9_9HYPO|nr:hypothetical protein NW762_011535 [Fusarium torreyae]